MSDSDLTILFNVDKLESGVTMRNNNVENCKNIGSKIYLFPCHKVKIFAVLVDTITLKSPEKSLYEKLKNLYPHKIFFHEQQA